MDILRELMTPYVMEWLLAIALIQIVILLIVLGIGVRFHKIRKQQKQLLRGVTRDSLEQLLHQYSENLHRTERHLDELAVELAHLKQLQETVKGNVGVVRYNALSEQGSELSFSLAIVDHELNGVVISSLYGRQQSYVYAKPLRQGKSQHSLSSEEEAAIAQAVGKK